MWKIGELYAIPKGWHGANGSKARAERREDVNRGRVKIRFPLGVNTQPEWES